MRPLGANRTRQPVGVPSAARSVAPSTDGGAAALRSLQRSAGNAAVARLVSAARQLQRTPTSLADVDLAKRKSLSIDTADVNWSAIDGGLATLFTNKDVRVHPRDGLTVNTSFGGPMSKANGSDTDEARVRAGLERVGLSIFNITDTSQADNATFDSVHFLDLDLSPFGGVDGRYRFSLVTTKKTRGQPSAVDLIIENEGSARTLQTKLDAKRRQQLQDRFDRAGQKRGGDDQSFTADPVPKWQDAEWDRVLQATAFIPDAMLSSIPGVVWIRGSALHHVTTSTGEHEDGYYESKGGGGTLTLYGGAFASDEDLIETVTHEFGHGIDFAGSRISAKQPWRNAALGATSKAVTAYGRTDWDEDYADSYAMFVTEPATLKLLRPDLFALFQKQQDDREKQAATTGAHH